MLATSASRLFPTSRQMPKLRKMSHPTPAVPSIPLTNRTNPSDGLGCNEEITDDDDDDGEEDEKEEEEAECSASRCKRPIADEISWVQCDLCQEWFHCSCVGLTKEYAEKIDKYNCTKCLDRVRGSGTGGVARGVVNSSGGRGSVGTVTSSSGGGRRDHTNNASSGGNGTGVTVKMKTVPPTSSSGSGVRGAPSSRVPPTTQELVKGILQNPQLAAQLLSSMPLK